MVEWRLSLSRFLGDQTGAVTIEFTTLVPFFVFLMVFFADAATIYLTHSEMYQAARDVSRRMATGELETEQDVQNYVATHLQLGQRTYTIDPDWGNNTRLIIALPIGQAAIFGYWFQPILGQILVADVVTSREPRLVEEN